MLDATKTAPQFQCHFPVTQYIIWVVWSDGERSMGDRPQTSVQDAAFEIMEMHATHDTVSACFVTDGMTGEDVTESAHSFLRNWCTVNGQEWPEFIGGPSQVVGCDAGLEQRIDDALATRWAAQ